MKKLHPIMFAGTGSDVGKSIIAAAFCRIFKQDGYCPAPFKAQNMALNSYATPEGLEIGRAQAVQAEAAGVPCHTDMNPLLLKPQSDHTSQVVLHGKPIGNRPAYDYFRKEGREELRKEVYAAFDRLSARYNPVVMEGAGSLAEINLRETDLVNMPMAIHAGADVILVGDIDRGGVFASVYGSLMLLTPEERKHVKGILINKFRGDIRLFEPGIKMLEELCGIPVLGVVPYYKDIHIEEEDSVSLAMKSVHAMQGKVNVAVVLLRHLSNFTDFNVLERDPRVHLFYTNNVDELEKADIILLPGSKSTLDDLYELRRNGVAGAIVRARRRGATIMGICGGYQMMGQQILDPEHVEGDLEALPGLGLLPMVTRMSGEKVTRQIKFTLSGSSSDRMEGYEIHMGVTTPVEGETVCPLNRLEDGSMDGCRVDEKCMGTYIHGILDNASFIDFLLKPYAHQLTEEAETFNYQTYKEQQYDKLADHVRAHVNIPLVYQILTEDYD
jgi:adenosylcobyric acid synthase